jgi:hypothetical protein
MEIHPRVKLALVLLVLIILVAPTLGAQIVQGMIHGIEGAIESLKTFGEAF